MIHGLKPVAFSVSDQQDIYQVNSLTNKIKRIAWLIFSVLVFPVGIVRLVGWAANRYCTRNILLPGVKIREEYEATMNNFRSHHYQTDERVTIETADKVKLDTLVLENPTQKIKRPDEQKWIIFLNGNLGCYEGSFVELQSLRDHSQASIYTGNYRGVMYSEGMPTCAKDLQLDGEAMVQYLLNRGVAEKNILLFGWSMGGGVACAVAAQHKEICLGVNRSYSSVTDLVKHQQFLKMSPFLRSLSASLIHLLEWEYDNVENFQKVNGRKFMIYHLMDQIIPHLASLPKQLDLRGSDHGSPRICLSKRVPNPHADSLATFTEEYPAVIAQIRLTLMMA